MKSWIFNVRKPHRVTTERWGGGGGLREGGRERKRERERGGGQWGGGGREREGGGRWREREREGGAVGRRGGGAVTREKLERVWSRRITGQRISNKQSGVSRHPNGRRKGVFFGVSLAMFTMALYVFNISLYAPSGDWSHFPRSSSNLASSPPSHPTRHPPPPPTSANQRCHAAMWRKEREREREKEEEKERERERERGKKNLFIFTTHN